MEEPAHCHEINTEEVVDHPWFHEVKRYLEAQEFAEGASVNDKKFLRRFSAKFFLRNGILYKHNQDCILLRYVDKVEAEQIYGKATTGLPWKLTAINTPGLVINVKSMQTRCTCPQFL